MVWTMKRSTYKKLLDACRAEGRVSRGDWGLRESGSGKYIRRTPGCQVCAIGAFLLGKDAGRGCGDREIPYPLDRLVHDAAEALNLTESEVDDFVYGFDSESTEQEAILKAARPFELAGLRMAKTLEREGILRQ